MHLIDFSSMFLVTTACYQKEEKNEIRQNSANHQKRLLLTDFYDNDFIHFLFSNNFGD